MPTRMSVKSNRCNGDLAETQLPSSVSGDRWPDHEEQLFDPIPWIWPLNVMEISPRSFTIEVHRAWLRPQRATVRSDSSLPGTDSRSLFTPQPHPRTFAAETDLLIKRDFVEIIFYSVISFISRSFPLLTSRLVPTFEPAP